MVRKLFSFQNRLENITYTLLYVICTIVRETIKANNFALSRVDNRVRVHLPQDYVNDIPELDAI